MCWRGVTDLSDVKAQYIARAKLACAAALNLAPLAAPPRRKGFSDRAKHLKQVINGVEHTPTATAEQAKHTYRQAEQIIAVSGLCEV